MKTFIYATDYSSNSVAALHFANALSQELNAKLIALHVFELSLTLASTVSHTYSRKEVRAFADHRERLLDFCSEHLINKPGADKINCKIDEGKPAHEIIIKNALEHRADLIIVGAKGGNAIREALLGSTTTSLINSAPCPVLAVPDDADFHGFKKMVYATDFEGADIFTIEKMTNLAKPLQLDLHLVHVSTIGAQTSKDQMEWFKGMLRHKVNCDSIHFDLRFGEDVFATLQQYIDEIEPDMVAMLEREGHSLIKDLTHRDLVKRMKSEGHLPLLSYHKKNILE